MISKPNTVVHTTGGCVIAASKHKEEIVVTNLTNVTGGAIVGDRDIKLQEEASLLHMQVGQGARGVYGVGNHVESMVVKHAEAVGIGEVPTVSADASQGDRAGGEHIGVDGPGAVTLRVKHYEEVEDVGEGDGIVGGALYVDLEGANADDHTNTGGARGTLGKADVEAAGEFTGLTRGKVACGTLIGDTHVGAKGAATVVQPFELAIGKAVEARGTSVARDEATRDGGGPELIVRGVTNDSKGLDVIVGVLLQTGIDPVNVHLFF